MNIPGIPVTPALKLGPCFLWGGALGSAGLRRGLGWAGLAAWGQRLPRASCGERRAEPLLLWGVVGTRDPLKGVRGGLQRS